MNSMQDKKKSAIILDDHKLFAESFSKILEDSGFFTHVVFFSDADELLKFMWKDNTGFNHYLFLDYFLKDKTIVSIINDLKRLSKNEKIIIISAVETPIAIKNLLHQDVDAILHKSISIQELVQCLHFLEMNNKYYSDIIRKIINNLTHTNKEQTLTAREIELLQYFSKGMTVDETAHTLHLSRHTIAAHRRKMFLKTGSSNIAELLLYARKQELI